MSEGKEVVIGVDKELSALPGHLFVLRPEMTLRDWFAGMALQGMLASRFRTSTLAGDAYQTGR